MKRQAKREREICIVLFREEEVEDLGGAVATVKDLGEVPRQSQIQKSETKKNPKVLGRRTARVPVVAP